MEHKGLAAIGFHLPQEPYSCLSNWYKAPFTSAGMQYNCSEQYMMRQKVLTAGESGLADAIMQTDDPAKMQKLAGPEYFKTYGGAVEAYWNRYRGHIVKRAVRAKFAQNPDIRRILLDTGDALLCECAGSDKVWGIGIKIADPKWKDPRNWDGDNVLGRILMELRATFRQETALFGAVPTDDHHDTEAGNAWSAKPGMLLRVPQYHAAVRCYADLVGLYMPSAGAKDDFLFGATFAERERELREGTGKLPAAGFYEMKQEIFETEKRLNG